MYTLLSIEADFLALLICIVMLVNVWARAGNYLQECKLVILLITLVTSAVGLDILFRSLAAVHNSVALSLASAIFFVYYIINNLLPFIWMLYVFVQAFGTVTKKQLILFSVPFFVSLIFVFTNPFIGGLYSFNPDGSYSTGKLLPYNIALCYFYLLVALIIPLFRFKKLGKRRCLELMCLGLLPFIGSIIQFSVHGLYVIWPFASISLLYLYLNILHDKLNADYLTGLNNRMQADEYIDNKIKKCTPEKTFSGLMIDIDNFKYINDHFGHSEGDIAIKKVAQILKKNITDRDFIARQGGDEFLAIIDTSDINKLEKTVDKIRRAFDSYNKFSNRPYELSISIGYDVYTLDMTRKEFLHHIDKLMYKEKKKKKFASEQEVYLELNNM